MRTCLPILILSYSLPRSSCLRGTWMSSIAYLSCALRVSGKEREREREYIRYAEPSGPLRDLGAGEEGRGKSFILDPLHLLLITSDSYCPFIQRQLRTKGMKIGSCVPTEETPIYPKTHHRRAGNPFRHITLSSWFVFTIRLSSSHRAQVIVHQDRTYQAIKFYTDIPGIRP